MSIKKKSCGLILKKTFFTNQLQVEKARYLLLESLISA